MWFVSNDAARNINAFLFPAFVEFNMFGKKRGSTEWTPIYLIIVLAIAVVLLLTFVKPLMNQASTTAGSNVGEARAFGSTAVNALKLIF